MDHKSHHQPKSFERGERVDRVKEGEVEAEVPATFAPQPTGSKQYIVTYPKDSVEPSDAHRVTARDKLEAWAVFCDSKKIWPSPKAASVVAVDPAEKKADEEAAAKTEAAKAASVTKP